MLSGPRIARGSGDPARVDGAATVAVRSEYSTTGGRCCFWIRSIGMTTSGVVMASATVVRDLEGKVALVTGATSGIGRAAAVQLAVQGATVIAHGRDGTRGGAVVAEIENAGGSAWFVDAELSEPAEALRLAEEVGDVDILVNNAGFAWFGPSEKLPVNTLQRLFAANVQAPYLLASVLAPKMVARGDGVIINVASRAGTMGQPDSAAYGATKAALTSLARSWAAEYGPA